MLSDVSLIASQIIEAIQTSRRRLLMVIFYWFTDSLGPEIVREQLIDRMLGKVAPGGMPHHDMTPSIRLTIPLLDLPGPCLPSLDSPDHDL